MTDYQTLIETAYDKAKTDTVRNALSDGALLEKMESEWSHMAPDEIINDIENHIGD